MTITKATVKKRARRESDILKWAAERGIMGNSSPLQQIPKLEEEFFEMCEAVDTKDYGEIKDAIGDQYVVLTIIANMCGFTMADCIEQAWDQIKDRTGYMNAEGIFVKEA